MTWEYNNAIGNEATAVEISWKTDEDDDYTTEIAHNNYYIIDNLQPSTTYQLRLKTICSDDVAEAYEITTTTTSCGITIGEATSISNTVPMNGGWRYTYTQMLYPADELIDLDTIKTIAFNWAYNTPMTRKIDIYMGHTQRNSLNNDSYINIDSLILVDSAYTFHATQGWCSITLDKPFVYNNDSNLVIAIDDNSATPTMGQRGFYVHEGSAIESHKDDLDINPADDSEFNVCNQVPDILFAQPCQEGLCEAPLLTVGEVTSTSVELVWREGNEDETYQVEYKLTSDDTWQISATDVNDHEAIISDLRPGSFYQFRVGNNCSNGIKYTTVNAFTNCAAIDAPLTEHFDNNMINPCWIVDNQNPNYYKPNTNNDRLFMGGDLGGYAISPEFNDDMTSLHVIFNMTTYNVDGELIILIGEDPNDATTFTTIDTIRCHGDGNMIPKECSFENYEGDGHFVAFYCNSGKVFIDDIVIETIPACGLPANLAISDITSESATITWTGDNRLTTNWLIDYNVVGDLNTESRTVIADEYSYTLTDLQPNTAYEVMVRNICGEDTVAALLPITFTTECGPMELPYLETFNNEVAGAFHPCWISTNAHTYTSNFHTEEAPLIEPIAGVHNLVMKFSDNVNMITPKVPAPAQDLLVNFDAKADDLTHTGDIVVAFSTTPSEYGMIVIDTVHLESLNWENYEVSFSNIVSRDTGYVIFRNVNNTPYRNSTGDPTYYNGYLDNVTISINNGCSRVNNVTVDNITATTAEIAFEDVTITGTYTIGYALTNDYHNLVDSVETITNNCTLTGLTPNTRYYAWVRHNCTDATQSAWVLAPSFKTSCNALNELPYEENFDTYTTDISTNHKAPQSYPMHTLPDCWSFINMSTTTNSHPQAFLSSMDGYADSANCLFMTSNTNIPLYAIMPAFSNHINTLQISFDYRNESIANFNGTLELGVMTDATDESTFTLIEELPQVETLTNVSHCFAVDGFDANTNYVIAFRYNGGSANNYYLSIDNVSVQQAPDCITPENLTVTNIDKNSVTLTWNGASANYNVQYREADVTDWTDAPIATTNTTTITGLNSNTDYVARVQGACDNSNSAWTAIVSFTTRCGAVEIPYSEDFNSYTTDIVRGTDAPQNYPNHTLPNCWTFPILENSPQAFLSRHSGFAASGICLMLKSNNVKDMYAVLPEMAEPVNTLQISFSYCNEGTNTSNSPLTLGVMTNPNDTTTFQALNTFDINENITEAEYIFTNSNLIEGTTYYIAFRYGHANSNYCLSIDNVVVDYAPTCPKPTDLTVDNITATTAELNWNSTATNFEVNYKIEDADEWTSTLTTTNTITLNLNSSTTYQARVRAICSTTDSSEWSNVITFTTECPIYTLPFNEDFTSCGSDISNLQCWNRYRANLNELLAGTTELAPVNAGWNTYNSDAYPINTTGSFNAYLNIYGVAANYWLVSPIIEITEGGAELNFDLARHDGEFHNNFDDDDQFVVLASNDNGTTWTALRTWTGADYSNIPNYSDPAEAVNISLTRYANQNIMIAFYGESTIYGSDQFIHIDNINMEAVTPTCDIPTDLAVENITTTTATLSWNGTASAYDVEYRIQGDENWTTNNVTEPHIDLTDLQPATTYEWQVRSNCGDAIGTSDWATGTFTTEQLPCIIPTNLSAVVDGNNVTIDWDAPADQSTWEINLTSEDDNDIDQTVAEHPVTINDLEFEALYIVKVRAVCDDNYSEWSEAISFQTEPAEGIDNVESNFQFAIYPNPTNGATTIKLNGIEGEVEISIVDMNGRTITVETIRCGSDCEKRMDVAGLAQGTYFVRVVGNDVNSVRKLIVR